MNDFKSTLNHCLHEFGLNQIEVGPLRSPVTIGFYESWLQENHFGTMTYLKNHYDIKKNPHLLHQNLRSVISLAQAYYPAEYPHPEENPARVALYARNMDYHDWLKEKLHLIIQKLQTQFPNQVFLPYVDSGPILERNWAYENRLGWFGKNTCLIHPEHGSLFFIAEILTSLPYNIAKMHTVDAHSVNTTSMNADLATTLDTEAASSTSLEPLPDFCGKCQKCLDICPTQALISPRKMKADLCISYLTIESKEAPPIELRPRIGDWFFGCDLCQTVCPWNEKVFRKKELPRHSQNTPHLQLSLSDSERNELVVYFRWLLTASHKQIQKKTLGSPLARAGAKGLKRNALIVIANQKLIELKPEVEQLQLEAFAELKAWTLAQLQ